MSWICCSPEPPPKKSPPHHPHPGNAKRLATGRALDKEQLIGGKGEILIE